MVNMKSFALLVLLIALPYMMGVATAYQCGWQAGGRRCRSGHCCSVHGYCGNTWDYCGPGLCQIGYGFCFVQPRQAQAQEAQEVRMATVEATAAQQAQKALIATIEAAAAGAH
ncbi:hypothetical protein RND81_11G195900 [Saponaria officinalis]|uniref:Chitin-binding type-1 domain-containing protein n=1 Tax=Saponaria officinalis TaxID=3572 RepID=A0AAW1HNB6_SAPOF